MEAASFPPVNAPFERRPCPATSLGAPDGPSVRFNATLLALGCDPMADDKMAKMATTISIKQREQLIAYIATRGS